jgi:photosystem II stability/assembly factor-like uncharacterized protein
MSSRARRLPFALLTFSLTCVAIGDTQRSSSAVAIVPDDIDAPSSVMFSYGGSGHETIHAIATDAAGNIYLAGATSSADLPARDGVFQPQIKGSDGFVAKLDRSGQPLWSTYLGGSGGRGLRGADNDTATSIAVDPAGNVYIAGYTSSRDFPTVNAFQPSPVATSTPSTDGFAAKLSGDGRRLIYSTYLGGADASSQAVAVDVGPAGDAWVLMTTSAQQFPTTHNLASDERGGGVVLKFSVSGSLLWSTRLGSAADRFADLAIDGFGQAHIATSRAAPGCTPTCDRTDALLFKLDALGRRLLYSRTVGGSLASRGAPRTFARTVTLTPSGSALLAGSTNVTDLPVLRPWDSSAGDGTDGYAVLFDPAGRMLTSSYIAGNAGDADSLRAQFDLHGELHLVMSSLSNDLAVRRPILSRHPDGPLFLSTDRAEHWTWRSDGLPGSVTSLAMDARRELLYAATTQGVFRSADHGATWTPRHRGLIDFDLQDSRVWWVTSLAIDPVDSNAIYAAYRESVFRSDDAGERWRLIKANTSGFSIGGGPSDIWVSPHDRSVWINSIDGIEVSTDGGRTWQIRTGGLPRSSATHLVSRPTELLFASHRAGVVFGAFSSGLFVTSDNGATWEQIGPPTSGFESPGVDLIAIDPRDDDTIYAFGNARGFLRTTDGGRSWSRIHPFPMTHALVIDPRTPTTIYAGISGDPGRTVLKSEDAGRTWNTAAAGITQRSAINHLLVDPNYPSRLFAGGAMYALVYVARLTPAAQATDSSGSTFLSYLPDGSIADAATTLAGETVIALMPNHQVGRDPFVVRVGR